MVSQVPGSLVWGERRAMTPRSRPASLGAASRTILSALTTSRLLCRPSRRTQTDSLSLTGFTSLCSRGTRGFPDISAQAHNLVVVWKGRVFAVNGTSCSTAILAGIFSLLNDHRLSTGQAQLGFLNPWLYGPGVEGLNNITSRSNQGCGSKGFSAIVGWDPVTGLGTPDFVKLQGIPALTKPTEPD